MKPAQLTKTVESLTPSRKEEIVGYVRNLIDQNDERVDSKTRLNALGKALGVDFNDET